MTFLCPEHLEINEILKKTPPKVCGRILQEDNFLFIINLLASLPIKKPHLEDQFGYVSICSEILNKRITRYQEYLRYLLNEGIIETDGSYVNAAISCNKRPQKCTGYRFTERYRGRLKRIEIDSKRLVNATKSIFALTNRQKTKYRHLLKWFNDKLYIDTQAALEFNERKYDEIKSNKDKWAPIKEYHNRFGWVNGTGKQDPFASYKASIHRIEAFRDFSFHIGRIEGRLYTNLTSLDKHLRQFVKYDGMNLVSLDVSSCQPFMLLILFNPDFWKDTGYFTYRDIGQCHLTSYYRKFLTEYHSPLFPSSLHMLDKLAEIRSGEGFHRYQEAVCSGSFYQRFYDRYEYSEEPDHIGWFADEMIYSVEDLKTRFLTYLNSQLCHQSAVKRAMIADYPAIDKGLDLFKRADFEKTKKLRQLNQSGKVKFPGFARLSMSAESAFMLFRAAKRVSDTFPHLPIFTIHDSILTVEGYEKYVLGAMRAEFQNCGGIQPTIKIQPWGKPRLGSIEDDILMARRAEYLMNRRIPKMPWEKNDDIPNLRYTVENSLNHDRI